MSEASPNLVIFEKADETMKRVVIHTGYPKAASTSLQNGLFLELHKRNAINFLGRAWESDFYGGKQDKSEYKQWFNDVVAGIDHQKNLLGDISDSVVNVLSEGLFMMNERRGEGITAPETLNKYFSAQADHVEALIVLRKQEELIPSYYVQNYRRQTEKSFAGYLARNVSQDWAGDAKIFNFYNVIKSYAETFGEQNVRVVLFEDFLHNKDHFSTQLARSLNVDASLIRDHLGQSHLNKTRKEADTLVVRKFDKDSLRSRVFEQLNKVSPKLADLVRIRLPAVTREQKECIHKSFQESNRKLAEEFGLDKQAMQNYGYF